MTYPSKGTWNRFLYKIPLIWWRMGLGPLLSHEFLGGNKMLALTTWGRKSGQPRHTILSLVAIGDRVYVCSGWGEKSDWYKNILADPKVTVCLGNNAFSARARRVDELDEFRRITEEMFESGGDSHFEAWLDSFGIEHNKEDMVSKRDRVNLVGFDPSEEPGPPSLKADLVWIWGAVGILLLWLLLR